MWRPIVIALILAIWLSPAARAADDLAPLEKAYRAYVAAVLDRDWDRILDHVSAEIRHEMETFPKERRRQGLNFLHNMMSVTGKSVIDGGSIDGDKGTLQAHVPRNFGTLKGEIHMRREYGRWVLHQQRWKEKAPEKMPSDEEQQEEKKEKG